MVAWLVQERPLLILEDGGRYLWDDIFWDDRDVIDKTRLTNVKFIFTDGTTKVFSGYSNIKKHMPSDAFD